MRGNNLKGIIEMKKLIMLICSICFCIAVTGAASTVLASPYGSGFTFDDIDFWVGEGESQSALVIEWEQGGGTLTLAWGYSFNEAGWWTDDDPVYGVDMLRAIGQGLNKNNEIISTGADPRLYVVYNQTHSSLGESIYGFGYDVDNDGFTYVPGEGEDGTAGDPDDVYIEGWYSGYWSYWVSDDGGSYDYSGLGVSSRELKDDFWDGWRFSGSAGYGSGSPPGIPVAAAPVPIPGAVLLFGSGLAGLIGIKRRRQ
ncbi:MAG: VPLPA-CTERM sorting domain-containing protein [Deltaproteobacteria bacterium]|nr:VPLPA-CTERM sorting domain-containing protein [Deltaproteobacteria bacterium]